MARLLALRPMFMLGDRSYAFYLWHWPVLILADAYVGHELSDPAKLGVVAGAFVLSCVSYALVENPIRRNVRSRRTTALVVAVCTAAFLGTSAASLAGINRAEQRFEGSAGGGTPADYIGVRCLGTARQRGRFPPSSPPWRPPAAALRFPPGSCLQSGSYGSFRADMRRQTNASGTTSASGRRPKSAASATRPARR